MAKYYDETNSDILHALCEKAKEQNILLLIYTTCSHLEDQNTFDIGEEAVFDFICVERFDAVVVFPGSFADKKPVYKVAERAKKADIPVISINRHIDGCFNILYDYEKSFEKVVRHVIEFHGKRKVNFIAGKKDNIFSETRIRCFKKVLAENSIEFEDKRFGYGDFWEGPALSVLGKFLSVPEDFPEAIICANDTMAIAVAEHLMMLGYNVPEDVIVTGFDGIKMGEMYTPQICTAKLDINGLVGTICDIVRNTGNYGMPMEYTIEHIFSPSRSCGCSMMMDREEFSRKVYREVCDINSSHFTYNETCRMMTRLNKPEGMEDILNELQRILGGSNVAYMAVCTKEDMYSPFFNFYKIANKDAIPHSLFVPFIDKMHIKQNPEMIKTDMILPEYDAVMKENGSMVFVSMHAEELCTGYLAFKFENNDFLTCSFQWVIAHLMQAINNFRMMQELKEIYSRDQLTGLYSRRGFYERIERTLSECRKEQLPFTVISFDMDGLKKINDRYGHEAGDYALKGIGDAILYVIRDEEQAARLGGDEFLIAFGSFDEERAGERAAQIIKCMKDFLTRLNYSNDKPFHIEISSGVRTMIPAAGMTIDSYMRAGDAAMYEDKRRHKELTIADEDCR